MAWQVARSSCWKADISVFPGFLFSRWNILTPMWQYSSCFQASYNQGHVSTHVSIPRLGPSSLWSWKKIILIIDNHNSYYYSSSFPPELILSPRDICQCLETFLAVTTRETREGALLSSSRERPRMPSILQGPGQPPGKEVFCPTRRQCWGWEAPQKDTGVHVHQVILSLRIFSAALLIIAKKWKQPKCSPTGKRINRLWHIPSSKNGWSSASHDNMVEH